MANFPARKETVPSNHFVIQRGSPSLDWPKEAVDSFLREGWRQERRASLERRSVDSSISVDKVNWEGLVVVGGYG